MTLATPAPDAERVVPHLLERLESAWERSDALFALLDEDGLLERGIPLRHPPIFYLGHLPAFAVNQVLRGVLGRPALDARLDELFERGIDPPADGEPAPDAVDWPPLARVLAYRDAARAALREAAYELPARAAHDELARDGRILHVVLEHELMHHETLMYLVQQLDHAFKRPLETSLGAVTPAPADLDARAPARNAVSIPAGEVTLGAERDAIAFGWDNEFPSERVEVPAFTLDSRPVTIGEFLLFVLDDGYSDPRWWTPHDRAVLDKRRRIAPVDWTRTPDGWTVRTLFRDLPLERVAAWPVHVSQVEARAYLAWEGRRLPTEAELHRAAFGTPQGHERRFPWGDDGASCAQLVCDFHTLHPRPVGSTPAGDSAFGVAELVGNGWEWTSTPFLPRAGFRADVRTYPGYSADFFDGQHAVVFGAAWPTDRGLLRRSFRNWYQVHYPYAFTTFRGAGPV
ncbi:MAG: SUMF1/EgtB/PvdO family nonheme iron enzyme [Planctomycetes bacterium]|nr:SUMF1/EgtB/PvdO family nonheme iron enzyme [Planctomycetota bacterium]